MSKSFKTTVPSTKIVTKDTTEDYGDPPNPIFQGLSPDGQMFSYYMLYAGLADSIIEGFNYWVNDSIINQLSAYKIYGSDAYAEIVSFSWVRPDKKALTGGTTPIYPSEARIGNINYSSKLYVGVKVFYENEKGEKILHDLTSKDGGIGSIYVGSIPTMVGSTLDNLYANGKMSDYERIQLDECPYDPFGYFIIGGREKSILHQEKLKLNRIILRHSKKDFLDEVQITGAMPWGTYLFRLRFTVSKANSEVAPDVFYIITSKFDVKQVKSSESNEKVYPELFVILQVLYDRLNGYNREIAVDNILQHVRPEWRQKIKMILIPSIIVSESKADPLKYIVMNWSTEINKFIENDLRLLSRDEKIDENMEFNDKLKNKVYKYLDNSIFPYIDSRFSDEERRVKGKIDMLSMAAAKMAAYKAGYIGMDDLNSWSLKRLESAGKSMELLFAREWKKKIDFVNKAVAGFKRDKLLNEIKNKLSESRSVQSNSPSITNIFSKSFGSVWGSSKNTSSQTMVNDIELKGSIIMKIKLLHQVSAPTNRRAPKRDIRSVQPSQLGFICPADTPERDQTGLVKAIAVTARTTTGDYYDQVVKLLNIGIDESMVKMKPDDIFSHRLTINGIFYGYCDGEAVRNLIIETRRRTSINEDEINLDKNYKLKQIYGKGLYGTLIEVENVTTGKLLMMIISKKDLSEKVIYFKRLLPTHFEINIVNNILVISNYDPITDMDYFKSLISFSHVNRYTSVVNLRTDKLLDVSTDSSRLVRPLLVVKEDKNGNPYLPLEEEIRKIIKLPHYDNVFNEKIFANTKVIELISNPNRMLNEGMIEYVDTYEQEYESLIGQSVYIFKERIKDRERSYDIMIRNKQLYDDLLDEEIDEIKNYQKIQDEIKLIKGQINKGFNPNINELKQLNIKLSKLELELRRINDIRKKRYDDIDPKEEKLREAEYNFFESKNRYEKIYKETQFTHCELDPNAMFGYSTLTMPLPETCQPNRRAFQAKMMLQALGYPNTRYKERFEKTTSIMVYPRRPIFEPQINRLIGLSEAPSGRTIRIAIMVFSGYNQEDSIIMNRSSVDLGLFRYIKYSTIVSVLEKPDQNFELPEINERNAHLLKNLDENGIPIIGSYVREGDYIVGKVEKISKGVKKNISDKVPFGKKGVVDAVNFSTDNKGNKVIKVRLRDFRQPEKGDKFYFRYSQKGTIGNIINKEDLPYTKDGLTADVYFNPHGIPTRMTIAMLMEVIATTGAAMTARRVDASAFKGFETTKYEDMLKNYGFSPNGKEQFYNPYTGEPMEALSYTGLSYHAQLRHFVSDKIQIRGASGKIDPITRQPVRGREKKGGGKLGDMEKNALISYGANSLRSDLYGKNSDGCTAFICSNTKCGRFVPYRAMEQRGSELICSACSAGEGKKIMIPFVFQYFTHFLESVGMSVNMRTEKLMSGSKGVTPDLGDIEKDIEGEEADIEGEEDEEEVFDFDEEMDG